MATTPILRGNTAISFLRIGNTADGLSVTPAPVAPPSSSPTASFTSPPTTGNVNQAITLNYVTQNIPALYWRARRSVTNPADWTTVTPSSSPNALGTPNGSLTYTPTDFNNGGSFFIRIELCDATGNAIYATAALTIQPAVVLGLALDTPATTPTPGQAFQLVAHFTNYSAQPAGGFQYGVDVPATIAVTGGGYTPSTGVPSTFTFTVPGQAQGQHTVNLHDVTNNITASVTFQVGTVVAGQPGALPAITIQAVTQVNVGDPIYGGHFFVKGDVAGTDLHKLTATAGGVTKQVQSDGINTWIADGSKRFAALYFPSPVAIAPNATASVQLGVGSSALTTSPGFTPAQLAAQSDFKLVITGGDYGSDTFTVSVNDILTNFGQWIGGASGSGWGANPLGGWELVRSGPVMTEWHAWRYLKRNSDGASHRLAQVHFFVQMWSDGAGGTRGWRIRPGVFNMNSWGPHPSATVGPTVPSVLTAGSVQFFNGSTLIDNVHTQAGQGPRTTPNTGHWCGPTTGRRYWVGNAGYAEPQFMFGHDRAYAIRTRCVLPYDITDWDALPAGQKSYPSNTGVFNEGPATADNLPFYPNLTLLQSNINAFGDGWMDARYGDLSLHSAGLFMSPLDQTREQIVYAFALSFAGWEVFINDERSGWPFNGGADPANCPSAPNPTAVSHFGSSDIGSPAYWGLGAFQFTNESQGRWNYGYWPETSHLPSLWMMPYLRTGDAEYEFMAYHQSAGIVLGNWKMPRSFSFGGISYDNVMLGFETAGGERIGAHYLRQYGNSSRMLRDTCPMMPLIKRFMQSNSDILTNFPGGAYGTQQAPGQTSRFGVYFQDTQDLNYAHLNGDVFPHLFMPQLMAIHCGKEARIGEYPGYRAAMDYLRPLIVGFNGPEGASNAYELGTYNVQFSPDTTTVYSDWGSMWAANGRSNKPATSFRDLSSPTSDTAALILHIAKAAIFMMGWQDTPPANSITVSQDCLNRLRGQTTAAGFTTYGPYKIQIYGRDPDRGWGATTQFSLAPPPGVV